MAHIHHNGKVIELQSARYYQIYLNGIFMHSSDDKRSINKVKWSIINTLVVTKQKYSKTKRILSRLGETCNEIFLIDTIII